MKLTLSMIAKGELANLERLHSVVKDYIDEWVVVVPPKDKAIKFLKSIGAKVIVKDFTQPIEKQYIDEFKNYDLDVQEDYQLFNFAAARNESYTSATGDYILWLDADDHPVGLESLRKIIESTPKVDVIEAIYDYAKDEQGNSISDQIRERVTRNNGKFEWTGGKLGLIHETLNPEKGYSAKSLYIEPEEFKVVHLSDHADASMARNHVALLYEYLKTNGADARTIYYLGVSFFNLKQYDLCVKVMMEYVKVGGWDEERYRAWIRIAEAYHQLGDKESSRNAYLNAVKELPNYPDAYLGLGESYYSSQKYEKAIEFLMTGMQKPVPKTKSAVDMVKYAFRPLPFLALSNLELGKSTEGYKWLTAAKKMNKKHPWVIKYEPLFQEAKDLDDYVNSFVKLGQLSQKYYPKTLNKLAEAVPDEIMDQEVLLAFKRKYTMPKVWPDKSVVLFCSQAFEEWGADSLETGTGGSEEAIIHVSKRLAAMGWDVTVFNNCPKEKTQDGVKWVRYERFNPRDVFNILVSWRNNCFLEPKVANKKFIDVHDVPDNRYFQEEYLRDVTVLAKSNYHRSLFKLPDKRFKIIPNGIDLAQFPEGVEKVKNSLVWTSSYDRGLEYLLEMWPDIKREVPDATLDICYGWNLFDISHRGKTEEGQKWKAKMVELFGQEGIKHHGRVNSANVAKAYLKADILPYPTDFPEISCITAMKAQAAGAIPVCTNFAALGETVKHGVLVEGVGSDPAIRAAFKEELIALLKDNDRKTEIRENMQSSQAVKNLSWDSIARQWDELFR